MPECPTAVIVAKPKRQSWALEEAWDLAVLAHPEGRAEATRFPGVILVYTPDRDAAHFSVIAARGERGFIQRIVPAEHCIEASSRREVLELVASAARKLASSLNVREVRLFFAVRGEGKRILGESDVVEALTRAGLTSSRKAKAALAVESVDNLFIVASGITYRCGNTCTLIYLKK
jgi:hypothetical protein